MTKDTQRHGEVAACHALIAHGRLGRTEMGSRQAGKPGRISGGNGKTLLPPSADADPCSALHPLPRPMTTHCTGGSDPQPSRKHSSAFSRLVSGCHYNGPRFSLLSISVSTLHYLSTFSTQHFTKLQSFMLSRASSFSLIPAFLFPCDA